MRGHIRLQMRPWIVALGVAVLIAVHVFFFNRLRHVGLSFSVISGLALLLIAKHLGALGPLYALFQRRLRRPRS